MEIFNDQFEYLLKKYSFSLNKVVAQQSQLNIMFNDEQYTSPLLLYVPKNNKNVIFKDYCKDQLIKEYCNEEIMSGMVFFNYKHFVQTQNIIVFQKDNEIIHPYLVLAQRGYRENFRLDEDYVDRLLIVDMPLDYHKQGYQMSEGIVNIKTNDSNNVYAKIYEADIEPEIIPEHHGQDYTSEKWFKWYDSVGFKENCVTMERLVRTYAKELEGKVIHFPGDGYGVGSFVMEKLKMKNLFYSSDPSIRSRIKAQIFGFNVLPKLNDKERESVDIEILLHVAGTGYIPEKSYISVDISVQVPNGRNRGYVTVSKDMPLKQFRVEGARVIKSTPIEKANLNGSLCYFNSFEKDFASLMSPVYLVKEKSFLYSQTVLDDIDVTTLFIESKRDHYVVTRTKQMDMQVYRTYGGNLYMYKLNYRNGEKRNFFLEQQKEVLIVGNDHNSIQHYGSEFAEKEIEYKGKVLTMKEIHKLSENREIVLRGPYIHNHSEMCKCLTVIIYPNSISIMKFEVTPKVRLIVDVKDSDMFRPKKRNDHVEINFDNVVIDPDPPRKIVKIRGLPMNYDKATIVDVLSDYGEIEKMEDGKIKNELLVYYVKGSNMDAIILKLHGAKVDGYALNVTLENDKLYGNKLIRQGTTLNGSKVENCNWKNKTYGERNVPSTTKVKKKKAIHN